jgi:hypothetical protein
MRQVLLYPNDRCIYYCFHIFDITKDLPAILHVVHISTSASENIRKRCASDVLKGEGPSLDAKEHVC